MIFAALIALVPACFIAFLALSKKTSSAVRKMAIGALILIGLAFITCTIIIVSLYGTAVKETIDPGFLPAVPVTETKNSITSVLISAMVILVLMVLVIVLAIQEQRRR